MRRSFAHRSNHNWMLASRDLQDLYKIKADPQIKKDLELCMKQMIKQQQTDKKGGQEAPAKA